MALPGDIRLRHPGDGPEDAVLALMLLSACQVADTGRSDRELADVQEQWGQKGVDLARDAWIALDAVGDAIGYAFVHGGRAEACVHPRARGRGLGGRLRELVEARALAGDADAAEVLALLERAGASRPRSPSPRACGRPGGARSGASGCAPEAVRLGIGPQAACARSRSPRRRRRPRK